MAAQVHLRIDEVADLEPSPAWNRNELHIPIGPLRLVLTEHVAVPFVERLEALVQGRKGSN
jgi:hypothetical protein